jgi:hypothetical protein
MRETGYIPRTAVMRLVPGSVLAHWSIRVDACRFVPRTVPCLSGLKSAIQGLSTLHKCEYCAGFDVADDGFDVAPGEPVTPASDLDVLHVRCMFQCATA